MRPTVVVLLALVALCGCGKKIGDGCTLNTDCDPQGGRTCDLAPPGGYCTIEGCDDVTNKCPHESACVRFFPVLDMTRPCSPAVEQECQDRSLDCDPDVDSNCCRCAAGEECIAEGFCVRRELERRNCMRTCGNDGDCRDGYRCYATGTGGSELIPLDGGEQPPAKHYCAPAE
ncbi:MAG: hypothetical protein HY906_11735 [Deltaproteobacteria bacterium]|nr:hypothetical protein [Deltaproteobacteria bacterium]